jgi:hypothetical protein
MHCRIGGPFDGPAASLSAVWRGSYDTSHAGKNRHCDRGRTFCRWYAAASGEPEDQVAQDHLPYVLAALRQGLREHFKDTFGALYHGIRPDAGQEVALLAAASGFAPSDTPH